LLLVVFFLFFFLEAPCTAAAGFFFFCLLSVQSAASPSEGPPKKTDGPLPVYALNPRHAHPLASSFFPWLPSVLLYYTIFRTSTAHLSKGPAKQKPVTPVVGGWVEGQKRTRVKSFFDIFCCVLKLPSPRNAQKRDKRNREKSVWDFFVDSFTKPFRHDFFAKCFL
jgi:hypothetical protein